VPIVSVRIPQMGEGLQEALLVQFLKKPGDIVRRDEPIYVMETDKASTEVESPYAGRLVEWLEKEGTVLPIGTEVARMEVDEPVSDSAPSHGSPHAPASHAPASHAAPGASASDSEADSEDESGGSGGGAIPPRTRKLLKEKGMLEIADQIPRRGSKLMPEDVERYLVAHATSGAATTPSTEYDESPVSKQQITLNYRLHRSVQTTVPVTVMNEVDWTALSDARQQVKNAGGKETSFAMMLWCVVQSLARHPRFRTSLVGDGTIFRTYRHVNLGIAVALPEDTLVTASIHAADTMSRSEFFQKLSDRIERARQGVDQADPSITISVSNIGTASMRMGIPAIVAPAVATLALGEVFDAPVPNGTGFVFQKRAQLTLAFDHRIINGVGAASFMNDLKDEIQKFRF
jgi:pyruvate/2-oxoglutarate dehydrogenase complex dihydrolipoamide acyltransferase (E2) component